MLPVHWAMEYLSLTITASSAPLVGFGAVYAEREGVPVLALGVAAVCNKGRHAMVALGGGWPESFLR